ncbi:hypothetical protein RCG51_06970 [Lactococcus lactis]|jgi:hypothetical protein|nr:MULTISPECIES: hypothetical protein [Lactococcus]WMM07361.1 hypothetical protein RCG32_06960 [Lactococcus lactis]WMM21079.1 hypothetical protein RCG38_04305 [Lactococcus lactis]WMM23251.1 hypothetical protein RCG51_06970 [Lactococcus lactis]
MNINDFDFDLPEELIAQTPLEKRSCNVPQKFPLTKFRTFNHYII